MVGFSFGKFKKIDLTAINEFIIYIGTPALIIYSLSKFPLDMTVAWKVFLSISAVIFISIPIATAIIKSLNLPYKVYLPPVLFANTGNLGLPLMLFAFGPEGFNIAILCVVVTTALHYTLGIMILNSYREPLEIFRLPLIYATIIGLVVSYNNYHFPTIIDRSLKLLAEVTIPSMIFALGYKLSEIRLSRIWISFIFGTLRMLLGFFIGYSIVKFLNLGGIAAKVVILEASMPPAVFNFVLAEKYKKDSRTVASIIMAGTIISFFILPLLISFLLNK